MADKKRRREWERCGEGFNDLSDKHDKYLAKRPRVRHQIKYQKDRIEEPLSDSDEISNQHQTEDNIAWTSSEEDESKQSVMIIKSTLNRKRKPTQRKIEKKQIPTDIDLNDSSSNSSSCNIKTENVATDFLIESEDSRSSMSQSQKPSGGNMSPEISESTSISASTSLSVSPHQSSKFKASEWIKMLDLKTPTKDQQDYKMDDLEDSAKKKKKYTKGGLAEQLSNLRGRERSTHSMIKHQFTSTSSRKSNKELPSKTLSLKVQKIECLYSLQLAHCQIEESGAIRDQMVMFVLDSQVKEGSLVQVFAPWQEMKLQNSGQSVLLCTYYHVVPSTESVNTNTPEVMFSPPQASGETTSLQEDITEFSAKWNCPCVAGLVSNPKSCPASLCPSIPGLNIPDILEDKDLHGDQELSSLHTIQASQGAAPVQQPKRSILEWIDCHDPNLSFSGRVQRVFHNVTNNGSAGVSHRYSLLVEDDHGTMCLIFLPEGTDQQTDKEGHCFLFSGLTVQCRMTRDRESNLFSVIDHVWSGKPQVMKIDSQNSDDLESFSDTSKVHMPVTPDFCYSMKEATNRVDGMTIVKTSKEASQYKMEPQLTLAQIQSIDDKIQRRVSVVGTILYQLDLGNQSEQEEDTLLLPLKSLSAVIYVTDRSIASQSPGYRAIPIMQHCFMPDDQLNRSVLLKDASVFLGKLSCDRYSCIYPYEKEASNFPWKPKCIDFDKLGVDMEEFCLCTVSGTISDVDENSAYTWEVCDRCHQESLAHQVNTQHLVCLRCKEVVKEPVTRMKLKVTLSLGPEYPSNMQVIVQLLQQSIEAILPDNSDGEGYEISSVLNKEIGPLQCVVLSTSKRKSSMQVFLKEINFQTDCKYCV